MAKPRPTCCLKSYRPSRMRGTNTYQTCEPRRPSIWSSRDPRCRRTPPIPLSPGISCHTTRSRGRHPASSSLDRCSRYSSSPSFQSIPSSMPRRVSACEPDKTCADLPDRYECICRSRLTSYPLEAPGCVRVASHFFSVAK